VGTLIPPTSCPDTGKLTAVRFDYCIWRTASLEKFSIILEDVSLTPASSLASTDASIVILLSLSDKLLTRTNKASSQTQPSNRKQLGQFPDVKEWSIQMADVKWANSQFTRIPYKHLPNYPNVSTITQA
jgi:hypothetical protein